MKTLNAEFNRGVLNSEQFPDYKFPEIAFAGRSNVGKSSLLNSILLRKNLARISSTPGKTQQINFYVIDGKWSFADLPGFGYAVISKEKRSEWSKLNMDYIQNRKNLKFVCALVDARHDPLEKDLAFIELLENINRKYLIILTKSDKISKKSVDDRKKQFEELTADCKFCMEVLPYSSVNGMGRGELIGILKRELK
ncbi:MAG: YihA family ribosome biogenesis GTP-binding protein [Ignavibacteriae bacterium]|nr:YihA family ribosome biogenesis GTP-binding protein [Ignavibacteriota bacterium]